MTNEQIEKTAENIAQNLYDYAKLRREPEYNRYDEGYLDAIELQGSFLVKEGIEWALQNQWISVNEELPEEDNVYYVLVDFNGHPQPRVTDFDIKTKKWTGYTGITHWMEIPKLNKD